MNVKSRLRNRPVYFFIYCTFIFIFGVTTLIPPQVWAGENKGQQKRQRISTTYVPHPTSTLPSQPNILASGHDLREADLDLVAKSLDPFLRSRPLPAVDAVSPIVYTDAFVKVVVDEGLRVFYRPLTDEFPKPQDGKVLELPPSSFVLLPTSLPRIQGRAVRRLLTVQLLKEDINPGEKDETELYDLRGNVIRATEGSFSIPASFLVRAELDDGIKARFAIPYADILDIANEHAAFYLQCTMVTDPLKLPAILKSLRKNPATLKFLSLQAKNVSPYAWMVDLLGKGLVGSAEILESFRGRLSEMPNGRVLKSILSSMSSEGFYSIREEALEMRMFDLRDWPSNYERLHGERLGKIPGSVTAEELGEGSHSHAKGTFFHQFYKLYPGLTSLMGAALAASIALHLTMPETEQKAISLMRIISYGIFSHLMLIPGLRVAAKEALSATQDYYANIENGGLANMMVGVAAILSFIPVWYAVCHMWANKARLMNPDGSEMTLAQSVVNRGFRIARLANRMPPGKPILHILGHRDAYSRLDRGQSPFLRDEKALFQDAILQQRAGMLASLILYYPNVVEVVEQSPDSVLTFEKTMERVATFAEAHRSDIEASWQPVFQKVLSQLRTLPDSGTGEIDEEVYERIVLEGIEDYFSPDKAGLAKFQLKMHDALSQLKYFMRTAGIPSVIGHSQHANNVKVGKVHLSHQEAADDVLGPNVKDSFMSIGLWALAFQPPPFAAMGKLFSQGTMGLFYGVQVSFDVLMGWLKEAGIAIVTEGGQLLSVFSQVLLDWVSKKRSGVKRQVGREEMWPDAFVELDGITYRSEEVLSSNGGTGRRSTLREAMMDVLRSLTDPDSRLGLLEIHQNRQIDILHTLSARVLLDAPLRMILILCTLMAAEGYALSAENMLSVLSGVPRALISLLDKISFFGISRYWLIWTVVFSFSEIHKKAVAARVSTIQAVKARLRILRDAPATTVDFSQIAGLLPEEVAPLIDLSSISDLALKRERAIELLQEWNESRVRGTLPSRIFETGLLSLGTFVSCFLAPLIINIVCDLKRPMTGLFLQEVAGFFGTLAIVTALIPVSRRLKAYAKPYSEPMVDYIDKVTQPLDSMMVRYVQKPLQVHVGDRVRSSVSSIRVGAEEIKQKTGSVLHHCRSLLRRPPSDKQ